MARNPRSRSPAAHRQRWGPGVAWPTARRLRSFISAVVGRTGRTRVDVRHWAYANWCWRSWGWQAGYLEQATEVASYGYAVRRLQEDKERLRRELTALRAQARSQGRSSGSRRSRRVGLCAAGATDPARRLVVAYHLPGRTRQAWPMAARGDEAPRPRAKTGNARFVRGLVGRLGEWFGVEPRGRR